MLNTPEQRRAVNAQNQILKFQGSPDGGANIVDLQPTQTVVELSYIDSLLAKISELENPPLQDAVIDGVELIGDVK